MNNVDITALFEHPAYVGVDAQGEKCVYCLSHTFLCPHCMSKLKTIDIGTMTFFEYMDKAISFDEQQGYNTSFVDLLLEFEAAYNKFIKRSY